MSTPEEVDEFLTHYGVKGMRWGVRRRVGANGRVVKSEDREVADALKKRSVASMSNAELRRLNERLQLEMTYSQLMSRQSATSTRARGMRFGNNVLSTAKKAQEVYNLVNSPMAKAAREAIAQSTSTGGGRHRA